MKEATGELNMTVITVVAIAAVGMLFTLFVWPNIQANLAISTACANVDAHGNYVTNDTSITAGTNGYVSCANFNCTAEYAGKSFTKTCGA
jgi:hypothetical protein